PDSRPRLVVEADEIDHFFGRTRCRIIPGLTIEDLSDGQEFLEAALLQDDAHPLAEARPAALGIHAEHGHAARVAATVAFEDLDRRRLPGAVGTEQGEHLALRNLETDPLDRLDCSVRLAQSGHRDRCHAFPLRTLWPLSRRR